MRGLRCLVLIALVANAACRGSSSDREPAPSAAPAPSSSGPALAPARDAPDPLAQIRAVRAGADLTPSSWPNGAPFAVVLLFDFDAEYAAYGIGRQPKSGMQLAPQTSAGEFGARRGLPRILALLDELDVKASFAVPGAVAELHPESVRQILAAGHEIACHGYRHEDLEELGSREEESSVFERALGALEKLGAKPSGFRAPYGRLSPQTLTLVSERGFAWDSSLLADDFHPYRLRLDGSETRVVELPMAPYLNDWALFGNPQQLGPQTDPQAVYEIWKRELEGAEKERGVFSLTLHPQVIGRYHRVELLRRLLGEARAKKAWIARATDIVAHVNASAARR